MTQKELYHATKNHTSHDGNVGAGNVGAGNVGVGTSAPASEPTPEPDPTPSGPIVSDDRDAEEAGEVK